MLILDLVVEINNNVISRAVARWKILPRLYQKRNTFILISLFLLVEQTKTFLLSLQEYMTPKREP